MKMKFFATLGLLAAAVSSQAADVSVNDITVLAGTSTVTVPILISPTDPNETIGALNISFAAGDVGNAIPILNSGTEFDGSLWDVAGSFFGAAGTPSTHNVLSAVAMLSPLQAPANGTIATYTLDTSSLAPGVYELNPNFEINMIGTNGDQNVNGTPTVLSFTSGTLNIAIPEPSTVALSSVLAILGLVVAGRRRG
jgi:hypothetical protein